MKPNQLVPNCWHFAGWALSLSLVTGCTSSFMGDASVKTADVVAMAEAEVPEDDTLLVGDVTAPTGLNFMKIEAVSLMTGLNGTGSNPGPSLQRDVLLGEMQSHDVRNIEVHLGSLDTSLVEVAAYLPPGAEEGDLIDVFVRTDRRSQTTSLENGWLMRARMRELAILAGEVHEGHVLGLAEGPVLVDSLVDSGSEELRNRGRVLSGGMVTQTRQLGLRIRSDRQSVRNSAMIGGAINGRFQVMSGGSQVGVANPKTDQFIELLVPEKYKQNLQRYFRVVQSIAISESPMVRVARIERLRAEMNDPTKVATAALHLEAIGQEGKQVLLQAMQSSDPLVRFYAAEALAYLGEATAAPVLAEAARNEPAFRWHALTALSAMKEMAARESLISLLDETSAETRYGAFRALAARDKHDPLVSGRRIGDAFFHQVPSQGPTMVHVSRRRRPEIVVFGENVPLSTPLVLMVGSEVTIKSIGPDRLRLSRFDNNPSEDVQYECEANLADLLKTLARLDVSYAETLQLLQRARERNYFNARLVFDALPTPGRVYTAAESQNGSPALPMPGLFQDNPEENSPAEREEFVPAEPMLEVSDQLDPSSEAEVSDPPQSRGILGRIF